MFRFSTSPDQAFGIRTKMGNPMTLIRSRNPCASDMWVVSPSNGCVFGCLFCPFGKNRRIRNRPVLHSRIVESLDEAWAARNRRSKPPARLMIGHDSDPFQPFGDLTGLVHVVVQRALEAGSEVYLVTRGLVPDGYEELFRAYGQKIHVQMAFFSIDPHLSALFESNTPAVEQRLSCVRRLLKWGVEVRARLGPFIPYVSDTVSHIEDLLRYLRSAGIRRCSAGYLVLKSHTLEVMKASLPRAQYQLIRGSFQGQSWQQEGVGKLSKYLPAGIRLPGYERLLNLAKRAGMEMDLCACMNPCQIKPTIQNSCFGPASPRRFSIGRRGQLELFSAH